jgi:S1-C subfamily serine protease
MMHYLVPSSFLRSAWERTAGTLRVLLPQHGTRHGRRASAPTFPPGTMLAWSAWERGLLAATLLAAFFAPLSASAAPINRVVDEAQAKIVKIYGAGGFRGMEHYQSGMLISAEGHILTVSSYVLDTDYITVTLADGRKYQAKLLGADPRTEVAVLKIEDRDLPHFDLAKAASADAGTRVLALSNLFNIAMGNEPASAQHGTISVVTQLEARRGVFETLYRGPVYVLDMTTNNPGAAGGALVTRQGELVALLGKELRNSLNNTWLNYAVPISQLREPVEAIRAGKFVAKVEKTPEKKPSRPMQLQALGIMMVPDVLEWTPAYVDQVRPGSSAARAGLRPDDLVWFVGDRTVRSCKSLRTELESIPRDERVKLVVQREQELLELTLEPANEEK